MAGNHLSNENLDIGKLKLNTIQTSFVAFILTTRKPLRPKYYYFAWQETVLFAQ